VERRLIVWMKIHPLRVERPESFQADLQFFNNRSPYGLERMTKRQVVRSVSNHRKLVIFECSLDGWKVEMADGSEWWFESEINEVESGVSHPFDFAEKVTTGMIHGADAHRR
jgi:hypothetical protein